MHVTKHQSLCKLCMSQEYVVSDQSGAYKSMKAKISLVQEGSQSGASRERILSLSPEQERAGSEESGVVSQKRMVCRPVEQHGHRNEEIIRYVLRRFRR